MKLSSVLIKIGRTVKKVQLKLQSPEVHVGKGAIVDYKTIIINKKNTIVIGDNVYLRSVSKGYQAAMPFPCTLLTDVKGATIAIGANSRINGAYIHAQKSIVLGKNCVVASGVNIMDTNGHELYSFNRTVNRDKPDSIEIGNNVWIGLNAIILKGTVIGDNSVVGAGSVVKGIFPENSLIMGNPAKVVKNLDIK